MEAGVKVFAVALTATVLNAVLKRHTPELAILLGLCAGMWILWSVAEGAAEIAALAAHMVEQTGLGEELLARLRKRWSAPL